MAPELRNLTQAQAASFCPRCKCEFQERNLVIIKVVVILVIWAVSVLVIYMGFLSCLEPVLSGRRGNGQQAASSSSTSRYREHRDSDEEEMVGGLKRLFKKNLVWAKTDFKIIFLGMTFILEDAAR